MTSTQSPPVLAARIDAITQYLPALEPPRVAGNWAGGVPEADGTRILPWFRHEDEVLAFMQSCIDNGWVQVFEWHGWQETAERKYFPETPLLRRARVKTLQRLLTLHLRKDRFVEGHFAAMVEAGHIAAILRRLQEIRRRLP